MLKSKLNQIKLDELNKEKDKFIILPDDTIVYNTRSVIKGKGFTPNGDIVFVTYF